MHAGANPLANRVADVHRWGMSTQFDFSVPRPIRAAPTNGLRRLCWSALYGGCLAGLVLAIVAVSQGMRAVLEIGGSCGDDGTYGLVVPCPDGVAESLMGGIFGGIIAAAVCILAAWRAGLPQLSILAWPLLFGLLGWNFLEFGLSGFAGVGESATGGDSGLVICGVVFEAMALIPTLGLLYYAVVRSIQRRRPDSLRGRTAVANAPVSMVKR